MGDGPLTVMGGVEGLAFINTKHANHSVDQPDIELHFVSGSTNSDGGVQLWKAHGLKESFYKTVYEPINNKDVWSAIPVSTKHRSSSSTCRTEVTLRQTFSRVAGKYVFIRSKTNRAG